MINKDFSADFQYLPILLRISKPEEKEQYNLLLAENKPIVCDKIQDQLKELIKCLHPSKFLNDDDYEQLISHHLGENEIHDYGVWIYYSWNNCFVHILDEEEFIFVRTNRNQLKITREEQEILKSKKIGIIGLSVGKSIAITMAMERVCGEMRLADFDRVELSNLNRMQVPLRQLGLKKTIITAREISEIDPFIKVVVYNDGINANNLSTFIFDDFKLNLLVEVCDGLDVKIQSRQIARKYNVPVIMDTNDRGMLDVERFDLEPDRPMFHGLVTNQDLIDYKASRLSPIDLIFKIVQRDNISERLQLSMDEIRKTINTWPQLASSTMLGGALTTDVARRIFLGQFDKSGRFYVDFEEILK